MTLPATKSPDHLEPRWKGHAHGVLRASRRQFVYVWSAPRSPVARVVVFPLLLLATLVILALGLLVLFALLAVAVVVAASFLLVRSPLAAIRGRSGHRARRPPDA